MPNFPAGDKSNLRFSHDFMVILNCSILPMHKLGVSHRSETWISLLMSAFINGEKNLSSAMNETPPIPELIKQTAKLHFA